MRNKVEAMSTRCHEATLMRVALPIWDLGRGGHLEKESTRPLEDKKSDRGQRHPPTKMNTAGIVARNKKQPRHTEVQNLK